MNDPKMATIIDSSVIELIDQLRALPSSQRLSSETLEFVYGLAFNYHSQGQHESALRYFGFLLVYRPAEPRFLKGLALSYQRLGYYDEAIQVYSMAAMIEPMSPQYMMGVAECQLLANRFDAAMMSLNLVLDYCKEAGGHETVAQRAETLKGFIDKHACA